MSVGVRTGSGVDAHGPRVRRATWALVALLLGVLPVQVTAAAGPDGGGDTGAALAVRREYNEVVAAIDTLVRLYSAERFEALADPAVSPGVELPAGSHVVLILWADDEAQVYLNGAPVGETRLTPTRIEIPEIYVRIDNMLTARCWDTDRVESGFMAGLYVEDAAGGLRPVLTTTEAAGWTAGGDGDPAVEIYYAHTQPDIPEAQVIWGPQLFGHVDLEAHFGAADVRRAARSAPVGGAPPTRAAAMDFNEAVARLVGLQARRREQATRLQAGAQVDTYLHFRRDGIPRGPSFTLGQAAPLAEADQERVRQEMATWSRRLPPAQQELLANTPRALLGPQAATPAAPLPEADAAAGPGVAAEDRRADYRPPADRGTAGEGRGQSRGGGAVAVRLGASRGFLWRLGLLAAALAVWTGGAGWSSWRQWHRPSWEEKELTAL